MSLSVGIIGLPNVGKSTLFNALIKKKRAQVASYPFCTIKPNQGIIEVPDQRLEQIAQKLNLPRKIPTTIKFIDIAGLVKGAHQGEGLGNEFLAHIRECDCLVEVVRFFDNPEVSGVIDPESDIETIKIELILKDLSTVNKIINELEKELKRSNQEAEKKLNLFKKIKETLEKNQFIREIDLVDEEKELIKNYQFLTTKPIILVANLSEKDLPLRYQELKNQGYIPLVAQLESELCDLEEKEAEEYLKELGLKESGLNQLITKAYSTLNLITFYTLIPDKQIQAWSIIKGTTAPKAGGLIHSDFEEKFIMAEVINWGDLIKTGSWIKAKEKGLVSNQGKDYQIIDGDVIYFKI